MEIIRPPNMPCGIGRNLRPVGSRPALMLHRQRSPPNCQPNCSFCGPGRVCTAAGALQAICVTDQRYRYLKRWGLIRSEIAIGPCAQYNVRVPYFSKALQRFILAALLLRTLSTAVFSSFEGTQNCEISLLLLSSFLLPSPFPVEEYALVLFRHTNTIL